jgi:hypothetical protein
MKKAEFCQNSEKSPRKNKMISNIRRQAVPYYSKE